MHPHDSTWLSPRILSEIEISLDIIPTIEIGMAYGVTFLPPLDEEVVVLALADVDSAAAAADDNAGAVLADAQAGVVPRFPRRDDRDERGSRVPLGIGTVVGIPDVIAVECRHIVDRDAAHRRRDAAGDRVLEFVEDADSAVSTADVVPETLPPDAERRHDTDTGNGHAWKHRVVIAFDVTDS